jgi:hypothetical protein
MTPRERLFTGAAVAALVLWAFSRTQRGEALIEEGVEVIASTVRGIRNNNPGNIRRDSTQWQGLAPSQSDPSFWQFVSMDYGVRAIGKIVQTYQDRYGLNTVRGIISRWAPPSENDTGAYVANVAYGMGVDPDDVIDVRDAATLAGLVRGIVTQENGAGPGLLVTDAAIGSGVDMALA